MKIGLISDTHGSSKTFHRAMAGLFSDVEMILHAGDVLYHGPKNPLTEGCNTSELADDINTLRIPIMIAKGNCDSDVDQQMLNTPIMSPFVFLYVDKKRIMVLHGDGRNDEDLEELMRKYQLSLIVHGHSHIPRIKRAGRGLIVNPGTPTIPNPSSPYRKTVGIFTSSENRVIIFDLDSSNAVLEESLES